MKTIAATLLVLTVAGLALGEPPENPPATPAALPGSDWTIEQAIQGRSEPATKFGHAAVCEAVNDAQVMVGNMTDHATQKFKVVEALAGAAPKGELTLSYSVIAPNERQIKKGQRVIWIAQAYSDGSTIAVKALPDTDADRAALLAALKAAGIGVGPASQPANAPLVITHADNGKTVAIHVGQPIRVELKCERPQWWLVMGGVPKNLERAGKSPRGDIVAANEGSHTFIFTAASEGDCDLHFMCFEQDFNSNANRPARVPPLKVKVRVAAVAPTSQPALSKPVEKDGLSFSVAPAKTVFEPQERLAFRFAFQNTGKDDFCLYNKLLDRMYSDDRDFAAAATLTFTDAATKQVWLARYAAEVTRKASNMPTILLGPGESHTATFEFDRFLQFAPAAGRGGVESLPIGRYEVVVTLRFQNYAGAKNRFWSGEVTGGPVPVEIAVSASPTAKEKQP